MEKQKISRKTFLRLGAFAGFATVFAPKQGLATCDPIQNEGEGPFYTPNAPDRVQLSPVGAPGVILFITGVVYYNDCVTPIPNAKLDLWQTDTNGLYDNVGYDFRGVFYTDNLGHYGFETILPGKYGSQSGGFRPRHIHFKVDDNAGSMVYTSQLYFQGDPDILTDPLASMAEPARVIPLTTDANGAMHGVFDIIIDVDPPVTSTENITQQRTSRIIGIYPNPVVDESNIDVYLHQPAQVKVHIFDINGRLVQTFANEHFPSGKHQLTFNRLDANGLNLTAGVYIVQLAINNQKIDARRIIIQ